MSLLCISRVPDRLSYIWLALVYCLNAMGAYQIFSIPLQWLGSLLAMLSVIFLIHRERGYRKIYFYPLLFILLIFFISMLGWWHWSRYIDFSDLLPTNATTRYYLFVLLRYLQYLVFFAVCFLSIIFLRKNGLSNLGNLVVFCGTAIAIYAMYVYIAQIYEFPEITRSRIGTGGEEQSVIFTYAFHRAMGSFREPSHLAQFLVLPYFLTFLNKSYWYLGARYIIVFVMLLTGSLTGILAIFVGYFLAILLVFPLPRALFSILKFAIVLFLAGFLFSLFALPNEGGSVDIFTVLLDRMIPILQDGMGASNRAHIYEYVYLNGVPFVGYGFGNANLLIGEYMGHGLVGSFLSLYLNMMYSIGYFGFLFAIIFLMIPVFLLLRFRAAYKEQLFVLLGAYFGWLLVYSVLTEELSISFAIIYGACIHYYSCRLEAASLNKPAVTVSA